jgi:putative ABC transport system permease protein
VRKVLGAGRSKLVIQLMIENILLIITASLTAVSLIEIILPYFNTFAGKSLSFNLDKSIFILAAGLLAAFIAASYPALFISKFNPVDTLKKNIVLTGGQVPLRKILIAFQFSAALALMICSFIINDQMHFVLSKDLHIDINRTVFIPLRHPELRSKYNLIRDEFLQIRDVKNVAASSSNPANMNMINSLFYLGNPVLSIKNLAVDYNFINTMGLHLISGRDFSEQIPSDTNESMIINEAAAEKLKAIGLLNKRFEFNLDNSNRKRTGLKIIGIVKNFNYRSLYYPIEPVIIYLNPVDLRFMEVKLSTGDISAAINKLKQKWDQIIPNYPFDYDFLDQNLKKEYESDQRIGSIFDIFSLLAIFIGCLGLFGLASFAAEKRGKEIGVRKVLGSSISEIVVLLSKEYLKLVIVSVIIAVPVSYYLMQKWLEQFTFRTSVSIRVYAVSIIALVTAVFVSTGYQAVKAAVINPVKSLMYE